MKLILVTLFVTFTLSNCLLRVPEVQELLNKQSPSENLQAFWVGFFNHFNLPTPTGVADCFNDLTASLFFNEVNRINTLLQDAESRNTVGVHLDLAKLTLLHKGLQSAFVCVNHTQDWQNLLQAVNLENGSPACYEIGKYIFYQANFGWLSRHFPPIVDALNNGSYVAAGDLHANLFNGTLNWYRKTGVHLNILKGLENGVHIALGLPDAKSVLSCWDNTTSAVKLELVYGLAKNVSEGEVTDASWNTENWFREVGVPLMAQIPQSTLDCVANSTDAQLESQALNISVTSDEFYVRITKFAHSHQAAFWGFQNTIRKSFEEFNFLHAGNAQGNLFKAAVATA